MQPSKDIRGRRGRQMARQAIFLAVWLLVVWFVGSMGWPAFVPGNPNALVCVAFLLLPLGAFLEAGRSRWLPGFFLYGCLGSLVFLPLVLPYGRDYLRPAILPSYTEMLIRCSIVVLIGGFGCRVIAVARNRQVFRFEPDRTRCRRCGYLLYGLPEPRCPECGAPFDREIQQADPPSPGGESS